MAAIGGFYGGFWDTGEQEAALEGIFQAQRIGEPYQREECGETWRRQQLVEWLKCICLPGKNRKNMNASGNGGMRDGERQFC